jgi:hypothetical protein
MLARRVELRCWWCRSTDCWEVVELTGDRESFRDRPLCLTAERWSTEGRAYGSTVYEKLDSVDVGGVIGGEKEDCFCELFYFAEATQGNGGGDTLCELTGFFCGAFVAAPDGGFRSAGCDDVDADISWG